MCSCYNTDIFLLYACCFQFVNSTNQIIKFFLRSSKFLNFIDCECPDLIQNETPVRFLYGTQKNVRSDRAESSWRSN